MQPKDLFSDESIVETTQVRFERVLCEPALNVVLSSSSAGCLGSPGASSVKSPGLPRQSISTTLR